MTKKKGSTPKESKKSVGNIEDKPRRRSYKYAKLKDGTPMTDLVFVQLFPSEEILNITQSLQKYKEIRLHEERFNNISFTNILFAQGKSFYNCTFINVKFDKCLIHMSNFYKCKFISCDFVDTVIEHCKLFDCIIKYCSIKSNNKDNIDIRSTFFVATAIISCDISKHTNLLFTWFNDCTFSYYKFRHLYLTEMEINLSNCIFEYCENVPTKIISLSCPSDGEFIGWKYVYCDKDNQYLIKLRIPEDARRLSGSMGDGCRCDKAEVISIQNMKTKQYEQSITYTKTVGHNLAEAHQVTTVYTVGEYVYPDKYDDDRTNVCSNGIHFYTDKNMALSLYWKDYLYHSHLINDIPKIKESLGMK